jgi:hypothetical protein
MTHVIDVDRLDQHLFRVRAEQFGSWNELEEHTNDLAQGRFRVEQFRVFGVRCELTVELDLFQDAGELGLQGHQQRTLSTDRVRTQTHFKLIRVH